MGLNVLIVDDSKVVRFVIKKSLDIAGVPTSTVFEAENGREGLEILNKEWIDLVFVDINMPVMTGLEMIDIMNRDGILSSIPVVIISTEGSETRIDDLKSKGVRAYIRKPFKPEMLKKVVDEVVGGV
ncbi:MAG: response regulator [Candidatus Marinimicrobia bacterium]|nr:response regulator [Candidatus Neomarinimicrobiota bacterium]